MLNYGQHKRQEHGKQVEGEKVSLAGVREGNGRIGEILEGWLGSGVGRGKAGRGQRQ